MLPLDLLVDDRASRNNGRLFVAPLAGEQRILWILASFAGFVYPTWFSFPVFASNLDCLIAHWRGLHQF